MSLHSLAPEAPKTEVSFKDVTKESGISFVSHAAPEKKFVVESMNGGVAMFDFDQDGRLDIYLTNSYTVEDALAGRPRPPAALYRNKGNGVFEDVAAKAGVLDPGWSMGVTVGDYDNDGFDDLYVTCFGPNKLYRNRGNGTFEDTTRRAGVEEPRWSTGASWGDYDLDGDLDLFVSNYVDFRLDQLPTFGEGDLCRYRGVKVQCGPRGLPGAGDSLFRNNGDGTFTDITAKAGVADEPGYYGLTAVWTDLNDDGWPDLFVANDATPNYAYINNRDGTFTDQAFPLGLAVKENGAEQACMAVTIGDYNRDGRLDIFITNFSEDYCTLYQKDSEGVFWDISPRIRAFDSTLPLVSWGTKFFDYDHDGWLDLLVVNGHVYPQIEGAYTGGMYRQPKLFFKNVQGQYADITSSFGSVFSERRASRGVAYGDYDEDGDVDLIVNDLDGPPSLLRNEGGSQAGNWLILQLTGTKSNRNAIGAKVRLHISGVTQVEEVHSSDSYLSHSDRRLHFGLGKAKTVEEIEILWPSRLRQVIKAVPVNRVLKVEEGKDPKF